METRFHLFVCVFQVILAYESIVLCKCSGKYIDIYFSLKITFCFRLDQSSATLMGLLPMRIAGQSGSKHTVRKIATSLQFRGNCANQQISKHLLSLQPSRCHLQACGHLHHPCDGGSKGRAAH